MKKENLLEKVKGICAKLSIAQLQKLKQEIEASGKGHYETAS